MAINPASTLVISSGDSTLSSVDPFKGTILLGGAEATEPTLSVYSTTANMDFASISNAPLYSLIAVSGDSTLNLTGAGNSTITLADNAKLAGTAGLTRSSIVVNGGTGSSYAPTRVSLGYAVSEVVNVATTKGAFFGFTRACGAGGAAPASLRFLAVIRRHAGHGCARDRSWRDHTFAA